MTPGNGADVQWRSSTGGACSYVKTGPGLTAPYWVRVTRTGNSIVMFSSADGVTWNIMNTQTINMAANIYIGLSVSSVNNSALCTATFDNVTATP
jgi:regulation of enolase protein 1 (concanavalin A-like superfamily)